MGLRESVEEAETQENHHMHIHKQWVHLSEVSSDFIILLISQLSSLLILDWVGVRVIRLFSFTNRDIILDFRHNHCVRVVREEIES